jgi:hypothetical protein
VNKRAPLRLDAINTDSTKPADEAKPTTVTAPEPTTTIYARVPWSLGEKLRDLARERSRTEHRRVTVNELVTEAISKLAS